MFALDGRVYPVGLGTPAVWQALADAYLWGLVPDGLTPADAQHLTGRLLEPTDPFDLPVLQAVQAAVCRAVTGWGPHGAVALAAAADRDWPLVHGRATAAGLGLLQAPARTGLAWWWAWLHDNAADDPDAQAALVAAVATPLPAPARRARRAATPGTPAAPGPPAPPTAAPQGFTPGEQSDAFLAALAASARG